MFQRRSATSRGYSMRLGTLVAALIVWEVSGRYFSGPRIPSAAAVLGALQDELQTAEFWAAAWITLEGFAWGFGLSVVAGVAIGLVVGSSEMVDLLTRPYLRIAVSMPLAPVVPIFIVVFGFGAPVRVATIAVFAMPMVIEHTAAGVRAIERRWLDMARSFGSSRWLLFRRVILPGSMPGVVAGLRLGVGRAVIGMVVAELIIVTVGLGGLLQRYQARFDAPRVFAIVVVFLFIGLVLVQVVQRLEHRVLRWR